MGTVIKTTAAISLEAVSNVLRRKRQEYLKEQIKVDKILRDCRKNHESPGKGYGDELHSLRQQIKMLEQVVEILAVK